MLLCSRGGTQDGYEVIAFIQQKLSKNGGDCWIWIQDEQTKIKEHINL